MSEYTVAHFIAKFEAIPERKWCTHSYEFKGQQCALGHCGLRASSAVSSDADAESEALIGLFIKQDTDVASVNDGEDENYQQSTPRARILAALYDIKAKQGDAV